jgi:hypothetical protein
VNVARFFFTNSPLLTAYYMSEKNQPLENNNPSHQHDHLPPPPAYSPPLASYVSPPMTSRSNEKSSGHFGNSGESQSSRSFDQPYGQTSGYQQQPFNQYSNAAPPPPPFGGQPHGTSSSASSSHGGNFLSNLFGKNIGPQRKPLDPPPECFSRAPQFFQQPIPFAPIQIPCNGKHLDAGFPLAYPSHALHGHDVPEPEWTRFLQDLAISGRLSGGQKIAAHALPLTMHLGATGFLVSRGIERRMHTGKANQVGSLVDIWNGYYFNSRGVNITLMHGTHVLSGVNAPIDCGSSSSSSESSSEDEHSAQSQGYGDSRRDRRRADKEHRRHEKREKRETKRETRRDRKDQRRQKLPYYLILEYKPF